MVMVRSRGLEPPRCYSLPPQGSASTNSATSASGWKARVLANSIAPGKGGGYRPPDRAIRPPRAGAATPVVEGKLIGRPARVRAAR